MSEPLTFIRTAQLTTTQYQDVIALGAECAQCDGGKIPVYPSMLEHPRPSPSIILAYQASHLIGFLSVYFFYDTACEIALFVAPKHRRQGIANTLWAQMKPHLDASIQTAIFSSPHGVHASWLANTGLHYKNSEYEMRIETTTLLPSLLQTPYTIRVATTNDIPSLCAIDQCCFSAGQTTLPTRFLALLTDPLYLLFVAEKEGEILGKAHLQLQATNARLSDLAVLPNAQRQGLGRILLTHCINETLQQHKAALMLDVETHNQHALTLYTKLGFTITHAYDYWAMTLT